MTQLQRGLYEQLVDAALEEHLLRLDSGLETQRSQLRANEAADGHPMAAAE